MAAGEKEFKEYGEFRITIHTPILEKARPEQARR
jgi:hypothetical protein